MFGSLSFTEIAFVLVIALLVFGPRKLPELGKTLGKALGEFRRATTDLKSSFEAEVDLEDRQARRQARAERARKIQPVADAPAPIPPDDPPSNDPPPNDPPTPASPASSRSSEPARPFSTARGALSPDSPAPGSEAPDDSEPR